MTTNAERENERIYRVEMDMCGGCLDATGQMCHHPQCAFIRRSTLEWPLRGGEHADMMAEIVKVTPLLCAMCGENRGDHEHTDAEWEAHHAIAPVPAPPEHPDLPGLRAAVKLVCPNCSRGEPPVNEAGSWFHNVRQCVSHLMLDRIAQLERGEA